MTPRIDTAPLLTDLDIEMRVAKLLISANEHRFWLLFLDDCHRQVPTLIPVDGIPARPDPDDEVRLSPMLEWLVDMYAAAAVVIVLERPGSAACEPSDVEWVRCLRGAAVRAEIPVRGSLLVHDQGVRWMAPDEWIG